MSEDVVDIDASQKNMALLVYVLQGLGFFTGGVTYIVAIVIILSWMRFVVLGLRGTSGGR